MIRRLASLDSCTRFIDEMQGDPAFSDPMLSTPEERATNLQKALSKPGHHALGVFCEGAMTGLFVFLVLEDERYIEMIVGLSRLESAYEEIADYLQTDYPGFHADFVFNPANVPLRTMLARRGAVLYEEQQKMALPSGARPHVDTAGIEPLSEQYKDQYLAQHDADCYWTGERVAAAADRFNIFLAVDGSTVVGYLDVTSCFEENEIYALDVEKAHRRKGWGAKLLAKAIEMNRAEGMKLVVDVGNTPAIALFESAGFAKAPGQNSLTAAWDIPR